MRPRLTLFVAALLPAAASATVIVNDSTWTNPSANAWVGGSRGFNFHGSSGNSGNLFLSSNQLSLATGTSGRGLSDSSPRQTLDFVGDSLTATVSFRITGPLTPTGTNGFRIGLHDNSGGTPITESGYGNSNAIFVGWKGKMAAATVNFADATPTAILTKPASSNALIGTTGDFVPLGQSGIDQTPNNNSAFTAGVTYAATATFTRIDGGLNIANQLTGGSVGDIFNFSADDLPDPTLAFTTLAYHVNSNNSATVLEYVNVTNTVVPDRPLGPYSLSRVVSASWFSAAAGAKRLARPRQSAQH